MQKLGRGGLKEEKMDGGDKMIDVMGLSEGTRSATCGKMKHLREH